MFEPALQFDLLLRSTIHSFQRKADQDCPSSKPKTANTFGVFIRLRCARRGSTAPPLVDMRPPRQPVPPDHRIQMRNICTDGDFPQCWWPMICTGIGLEF